MHGSNGTRSACSADRAARPLNSSSPARRKRSGTGGPRRRTPGSRPVCRSLHEATSRRGQRRLQGRAGLYRRPRQLPVGALDRQRLGRVRSSPRSEATRFHTARGFRRSRCGLVMRRRSFCVEHCNEAYAAISGYSRVLDELAAVRVALVRGGQSRFARIHYDELHCGDQRRVFQRQVRDL